MPCTVHPRVCGEQITPSWMSARRCGSSPRVRGTAVVVVVQQHGVRFIPACAGNRRTPSPSSLILSVHPRVCGEQRIIRAGCTKTTGSSPRVRGTGTQRGLMTQQLRFIPACAGNRERLRQGCRSGPVHPRVCGEQESSGLGLTGCTGSSPRVRGTAAERVALPGWLRFIPACAGNRSRRRTSSRRSAVHPRVCGEQRCSRSPSLIHSGSSPRVRGTGDTPVQPDDRRRFIPACAGNSPLRGLERM